jgi:acyl dehydratase
MREPPATAKGQGVHDILSVETDKIHHEDIEVGKTIACGSRRLSKEEIIAFGRAYDPQPMHTDEEAAKATLVGGLCASGWHTCAIMMRLLCDGLINRMAGLGSPGVDEVRWKRPVRPGVLVNVRYTAREKRVLASRPDVGVSKVLVELVDDHGEVLCTWLTNQLTGVRHPAPAPAGVGAPRKAKAAIQSLWDGAGPEGPPKPDGFFEDRVIGEIADLGQHTFGREEIIAFAREFDPQPFHLDEEAAKASLFGGLCASGWHTAAHFIRGVITTRNAAAAAGAPGQRLAAYGPSPGFRDLAWYKPVFVGDTIRYRARLAEKIDLKTRPEQGLLASLVQGRNQHGEIVFAVVSQILAERRESYKPA